MVKLQDVDPKNIEQESFRIIEDEFESQTGLSIDSYPHDQFQVIRRVVHATGDFNIASTMRFSPESIKNGIKSLKNGRGIYVDVGMAQAGISKILTQKNGNSIHCLVHDGEVIERAKNENMTRSEAAIDRIADKDIGVVVIGNAPTALIRVIQHFEQGIIKPDLVVGVPVGFVNAAESKEMLFNSNLCHITCLGRRGGSPIAAAIINALLKLI